MKVRAARAIDSLSSKRCIIGGLLIYNKYRRQEVLKRDRALEIFGMKIASS